MRLSPFPSTQRCRAVDITHIYKMEADMPRHPAFQLLSLEGMLAPNSDYRIKQSSFHPHTRIFTPSNRSQFEATFCDTLPPCRLASRQQHATLPIRFPLRISCGVIGNKFSPAFPDIFAYRLLKADFNVHPYGRTIFSLILGLPEQSALISA